MNRQKKIHSNADLAYVIRIDSAKKKHKTVKSKMKRRLFTTHIMENAFYSQRCKNAKIKLKPINMFLCMSLLLSATMQSRSFSEQENK